MSDIVLHTAAKASTLPARLGRQLANALERVRDEEHGQDMIEYAGVLLVVAVLVVGVAAAVTKGGLFTDITNGIDGIVKDIFGGNAPKVTTPTAS